MPLKPAVMEEFRITREIRERTLIVAQRSAEAYCTTCGESTIWVGERQAKDASQTTADLVTDAAIHRQIDAEGQMMFCMRSLMNSEGEDEAE